MQVQLIVDVHSENIQFFLENLLNLLSEIFLHVVPNNNSFFEKKNTKQKKKPKKKKKKKKYKKKKKKKN